MDPGATSDGMDNIFEKTQIAYEKIILVGNWFFVQYSGFLIVSSLVVLGEMFLLVGLLRSGRKNPVHVSVFVSLENTDLVIAEQLSLLWLVRFHAYINVTH